MTKPAETRPAEKRLTSGLALRLAAMVLIALLPLGLLALAQASRTLKQTDETRLAASVGHTLQHALREIRLIRASQVTAQLLASSLRDDPGSCAARIGAYATSDGRISRAGFVGPDGVMVCSSDGSREDFSQKTRFASIISSTQPRIFHDAEWSRPGQSEIALTWPISQDAGRPAGFVLLWLPESALLSGPVDPTTEDPDKHSQPLAMIATNSLGEVVYASGGIAGAGGFLPSGSGLQSLTLTEAHSFFDTTPEGREQMFSWAPINTDLYLLGVWPMPNEGGFLSRHLLPYLFPALMWLAGIAVTVLGVERLVVRHVRQLSRAMRDFTSEERRAYDVVLDSPPAELASLAEDYRTLTATILRDEAELENLLRQKQELLREVHHRTGNSLQLIASFLRMHRRETDDEDIRIILDDLHNRVMSLSSVHLGLYRMTGEAEVAVDLLMAEVIAKVDLIHGRAGNRGAVQAELMPLMLPSVQAVPIALLLAEILSCFPPAEAGQEQVRIRLTHGPVPDSENRIARLEVSGARAARGRLTGEHAGAPSVIGARLIRGFVTQLAGTMTITEDGPRVSAVVTFAFLPLQGEATAPARLASGAPEKQLDGTVVTPKDGPQDPTAPRAGDTDAGEGPGPGQFLH